MDEQADDLLDELVLACLERAEAEGSSAIESTCLEHPELAEALRGRMAALADAGLLGEPDAPPERLGDFRLGKRLGGGGMGVVYAAVQEPLEREVALKIVRSDQLFFPGARERFRRELQLVARLAHAGIVPVYSAGEADGVPYFAMERLDGATLAEALAVLDRPPRRGRDLADAVARVVESRDGRTVDVEGALFEGNGVEVCVRIAQRIAQALAHAHERGVLHRDIKPSNVMLTTDGRALLFDFGLASSADVSRVTQSGSRVGSLAYMSPEQVRGESLDERSDVCGLGALLCEALTLRPPHSGGVDAVGAAILHGDPVSVRARRRDVPRDVETIVQTALAFRPEHRYASAAAMARDLELVLLRRPIEAVRAGLALRSLRWAQRHRARAALLLLMVLVPVGFGVQQHLAARRVSEQRDRAEDNLEQVLKSINALVWGLGEGFAEHAPGQQAARIGLLEDALAALDRIIPQRPDDAHLHCQWVRVQAALGATALRRGDVDGAEERYRAALAAAGEHDIDSVERIPLLNGFGTLLLAQGCVSEALEVFLQAAQLADAGEGALALHGASVTLRNASRSLVRLEQWEDAKSTAAAAIDRAERELEIADGEDDRFRATRDLGAALVWRGGIPITMPALQLARTSVDSVARAACERALPLVLGLAEQRPQRSDVVHEAVLGCTNASMYLPFAEAEPVLLQGLELADRLCGEYPGRAAYARSRVALLSVLGEALSIAGRQAEAHVPFERASREAGEWLRREPGNMDLLHDAALSDVNFAASLVQLDRRGEACEPAARGVTRAISVMEKAPEAARMWPTVQWGRIQEGHGRIARGEVARALELAELIPADALDDMVLAVSAGEILAGCAELTDDADRVGKLREAALDRLEQGIELGFTGADYLSTAAEWAGLRDDVRFEQLVDGARTTTE